MAGWTLVPESPQGAPSAPPDAAGAWTPVPETQARQRASQPQESAFGELLDMGKLGTSLVFSQMMGIHPTLAYEQKEHIEKQLHDVAGDFTARMSKAATVKDDPLYMLMKHKGPEPFESHDMLENFVHDVSELIGDPVVYGPMIAGTLLGSPRAGADAGFVLDAGLRKMLTDHYQKGDIKSFGELASRTASTLWEATKGLATGEAMHLAGGLPVPSVVGSLAPAVRGLYQASAMTVAGGLLNWQVPTLEQFTRNAVLVGGLGLITHAGSMVVVPDMKQAMMDVYTKDGTKPEETAIKLQAQPPVKPAQPEGLHPAIKLANGEVIHGNEGETHSDLAERITGERPVTIEQLEADPKLADKVLTNPAIQVQQVIDKAHQLKDERDPFEYQYTPLTSETVPPSKRFYHGTQSTLTDLEEAQPLSGSELNIYGPGLYLTDNPNVADSYARNRKSAAGNAKVLFTEIPGAKLLNLEEPLPPNLLEKVNAQAEFLEFDKLPEGTTGADAFKELRKSSGGAGIPAYEVQDIMADIQHEAAQMGYDGWRHEGGTLTKSKLGQHNVAVLFPDDIKGSGTIYGNRAKEPIQGEAAPESFPQQATPQASANLKSGRGFAALDKRYLNREQAKRWVKSNEPETHEMWLDSQGGDNKAEFHSQDYQEARSRVAQRNHC